MKFAVIIPAAGQSSRFAGNRKKPFEDLSGRAVWLRTADHFVNRDDVTEVILVLADDDIEDFKIRFEPNLAFMNLRIVAGGNSRAESVQNGISALQEQADFIAVHDAARPLLTKSWVSDVFAAAIKHGAVIPGTPVSSTVKRVDEGNNITETVDRSSLWLAQTPQVFRREVLEKAYQDATDHSEFTDEASIVEASGQAVFVHEGWPMNIKITTIDDMKLAEVLLKALPTDRGLGALNSFSEDRFL